MAVDDNIKYELLHSLTSGWGYDDIHHRHGYLPMPLTERVISEALRRCADLDEKVLREDVIEFWGEILGAKPIIEHAGMIDVNQLCAGETIRLSGAGDSRVTLLYAGVGKVVVTEGNSRFRTMEVMKLLTESFTTPCKVQVKRHMGMEEIEVISAAYLLPSEFHRFVDRVFMSADDSDVVAEDILPFVRKMWDMMQSRELRSADMPGALLAECSELGISSHSLRAIIDSYDSQYG